MLSSDEVWQALANFPFLRQVWDQIYIVKDSQDGFRQPWLNRLAEDHDREILTELEKLDRYLRTINTCRGFQKLRSGLRSRDIEQFQSTLAEIKTAVWIAESNTLLEIRPRLSQSSSEGDFMISLAGNTIYGEVLQPRELPSSWVSVGEVPFAITSHGEEAPKRKHTLRQKGDSQLPISITGIWVAHLYHVTLKRSWIDFFAKDMVSRSNVLGVALWVRAGSRGFQPEGVRCKGLTGEGHDIYWLDNTSCENIQLQRKLVCSFIE